MDKVELIFVEPRVLDQVSYICFIYLILRTGRHYYCTHFTDEEIEALSDGKTLLIVKDLVISWARVKLGVKTEA